MGSDDRNLPPTERVGAAQHSAVEIALSEMAYAFPLVRYDEPGLRVEF